MRLLYISIDLIFVEFAHHIGVINRKFAQFPHTFKNKIAMPVKMLTNNFAGLNFFPLWRQSFFVVSGLNNSFKIGYWNRFTQTPKVVFFLPTRTTPSMFERKVWSECTNGDGQCWAYHAYGASCLSNNREEKTTVLQSTICVITALEYKYCWLITYKAISFLNSPCFHPCYLVFYLAF